MELPVGIELANPGVVLDGVNVELMNFLSHLAMVHKLLFGSNLVVTSGRDGHHVQGSLHAEGRAVDLRTNDKTPGELDLFLHVISYCTAAVLIACFDERNVPGGAHLHLEWHGA